MPTRQLSIYLLSTPLKPEDIRPGAAAHRIDLGDRGNRLLLDVREPDEPAWLTWMREGDSTVPIEKPRTVGGLLLFSASRRTFAIAFGTGRRFLKDGEFVRDFGRDVALRALDPGKLRAVDARALSVTRLTTRRQVNQNARVRAFDLDHLRDTVSALRGVPVEPRIGDRLGGRDSVLLSADHKLQKLPTRCSKLLTAYRSGDYTKTFPFADDLRPVEGASEIDALNGELFKSIRAGTVGDIRVGPPEALSDAFTGGFAVRKDEPDTSFAEVTMVDVMPQLGSLDGVDDRILRDRLMRVRLWAFDDSGAVRNWLVLHCLEAELHGTGHVHVFDDGRWWKVRRGFLDEIVSDIKTVKKSGVKLPKWTSGDEEAYNLGASKSSQRFCLDRKSISPAGADAVEPCDIYVKRRRMLHVKRDEGGSGTLSHLFAQGAVAAELLADEPTALTNLRTLLAGAPTLAAEMAPGVRPDQFTIGYCIGTKKNGALRSPDRRRAYRPKQV